MNTETRDATIAILDGRDWTIDTNALACAIETVQRKWTLSDDEDREDLQFALDVLEGMYRHVMREVSR